MTGSTGSIFFWNDFSELGRFNGGGGGKIRFWLLFIKFKGGGGGKFDKLGGGGNEGKLFKDGNGGGGGKFGNPFNDGGGGKFPEFDDPPGFWKLAYNNFLAALKLSWFPLISYLFFV